MVESALDRLRAWSPHFARRLERDPDEEAWLRGELAGNRDWDTADLEKLWQALAPDEPTACTDAALGRLQRLRQRVSLWVAAREIGGLAPVETSLREMTLLAEFCLRKLCGWLFPALVERHGEPFNAETGRPARWCVMALGKLGGGELNFCSDLDLIYVVDGHGPCRRDGKEAHWDSRQFFDRFFRELSAKLAQTAPEGQLYRLDLRLRPEGDAGPLVRTFAALTGYYWSAGQLWERMAWLKARPVAGDAVLAGEILDELNPFRYPRSLSGNLLAEVAGLKARTEREVVGAAHLAADIKSGPGGIREIEYRAQALQLLEGGNNPFLQTGSTLEALRQLARYGRLDAGEAEALAGAYRFLRAVENRLQMRGDSPAHRLPEGGPTREALAASLGLAGWGELEGELARHRDFVHTRYTELFAAPQDEEALQAWSAFFGGKAPEPSVRACLERWFPLAEDAPERLRHFLLGETRHLVTREQVRAFLGLSATWDELLPPLACPLRALERVGDFADRYGSRRQFFQTGCDAGLLRALCLLFDRSDFIFTLFCRHPEMVDELMAEAPRRRKTPTELRREIGLLPRGEDFPRLLWLYVKAEQVRLTMGELLYGLPPEQTVRSLTALAEAALGAALAEADPAGELAVIAAGKFGGGELTPGSDLDLMVWGTRKNFPAQTEKARELVRLLGHKTPLGRTFEIDQRLRPHGADGPLVVTPEAFGEYHAGGGAQTWERQLLCRCRPVAGNARLRAEFERQRDALLYAGLPPRAEDFLHMRRKIEANAAPEADLAFKAGPGGLVDIDFAAQWLQMTRGRTETALRVPTSRKILRTAARIGCLDAQVAEDLLEDHGFMRTIELNLRRIDFTGVSRLPEGGVERRSLAHWMGYDDFDGLRRELRSRMQRVRSHFHALLEM
jgi:glutamate-ammonia-ligase adenylyltransferase